MTFSASGLGCAWTIGAIYWASIGATQEWLDLYPTVAEKNSIALGDSAGLAVIAGSLSTSVMIFSICAVVCLGTLALRRRFLGAELGARLRKPTAALFVSLWLLYILLSALDAYGYLGKNAAE